MHRFLRLAHDQVFEAWLETPFAKEIDETFPRVTDWRARMAGYLRRAVSDAADVAGAFLRWAGRAFALRSTSRSP